MENKEEYKPKPLYAKPLFWVVLILFVAIINSSNKDKNGNHISLQQKESSPALTIAAGKTWKEVKSWNGSGIKKTEPFSITSLKWRIKYSLKDDSDIGSMFQGFVMTPGKETPMEVFGNSTKEKSEETYVYKSGDFYLSINSAKTSWNVVVEEYK